MVADRGGSGRPRSGRWGLASSFPDGDGLPAHGPLSSLTCCLDGLASCYLGPANVSRVLHETRVKSWLSSDVSSLQPAPAVSVRDIAPPTICSIVVIISKKGSWPFIQELVITVP